MATGKDHLVDDVVSLVVEMQDSTMAVDEAAAQHLDVNPTDLLCLRHLVQQGPLTPGRLAVVADRTPAAITVAVDRLTRAGLAARTPDPTDRRRTLVQATDVAYDLTTAIWEPLEREGRTLLAGFSTTELEAFVRFLKEGVELQQRHAERVRGLKAGHDEMADP